MTFSKRKQQGFSLLEIMVAIGIGLIAATAIFWAITRVQKESITAANESSTRNEFSVMASHLKRFLSPGTVRFYGFSGKTPTSNPADQTLARLLIPLLDTCADLSSCPGSASMLYVSYDKTKTTSLTAICALGTDSWVIDTANTTYGQATFASGAFSIAGGPGFAPENITFGNGQLLGLMNPPFVTLWRPGTPSLMRVYKDSSGKWVYDDTTGIPQAFPQACIAQLQGGANPVVSGLVRVPIQPASLAQFSGGLQLWTATDLEASSGNFPMRLLPVVIRSVGKINNLDPVRHTPRSQLTIRNCAYAGTTIACDGSDFMAAGPLASMRIEEGFTTALNPRSDINRFELIKAGSPVSKACDTTGCAGLPIADITNMPVLYGGNETVETLSSDGFSLGKQEYVQLIRLRLQFDTSRTDFIDVPIQ